MVRLDQKDKNIIHETEAKKQLTIPTKLFQKLLYDGGKNNDEGTGY